MTRGARALTRFGRDAEADMDAGKRSATAVVTEHAAQAALRRGAVPALAADEEKALRMRLGAGLPLSARLARLATASDADIELLAYEIEAYLHLRPHARSGVAAPSAASPTASRAKEKIVRALRRKG
jgi:hypothetical protein